MQDNLKSYQVKYFNKTDNILTKTNLIVGSIVENGNWRKIWAAKSWQKNGKCLLGNAENAHETEDSDKKRTASALPDYNSGTSHLHE